LEKGISLEIGLFSPIEPFIRDTKEIVRLALLAVAAVHSDLGVLSKRKFLVIGDLLMLAALE
jgi:hypothetical protein